MKYKTTKKYYQEITEEPPNLPQGICTSTVSRLSLSFSKQAQKRVGNSLFLNLVSTDEEKASGFFDSKSLRKQICRTLLASNTPIASSGFFDSKSLRKQICRTLLASNTPLASCGFFDSKAQRKSLFSGFVFTGKERDQETGYGYFGARYYDSELTTGWLSVDPMSDKYPSVAPYHYCIWNPVQYVAPNGMWHWTKAGDLKSNKNDDVNTLNQFLGITNSDQIVRRCNVDFQLGTIIIPSQQLWVELPKDNNDKTIESTKQAVAHYYFGDGNPVNIGHTSTEEMIQSTSFQERLSEAFCSTKDKGAFGVNMKKLTFHIGRTNITWSKESSKNTDKITAKLYVNDGFWDPDFIDEFIGGDLLKVKHLQADGVGPNLERGGTPYRYNVTTCVFFKQKQNEEQ